jgi:transcriptional regulator with XRE-family HTH domain
MHETLDTYVRQRAQARGFSLSQLSREAGVSRQTVYDLAELPNKMPSLKTLIQLAQVLEVHPLRLIHLVFDAAPDSLPTLTKTARKPRSDLSAFVKDVTFPDGEFVLPKQRFLKTWEVQNVGKVVWENRFLQCADEEIVVYSKTGLELALANGLKPVQQRVPVPLTLPGAIASISVEFVAPELSGTVLSYWKSIFEDGTQCFPKSAGLWCKVRVRGVTAAASQDRNF